VPRSLVSVLPFPFSPLLAIFFCFEIFRHIKYGLEGGAVGARATEDWTLGRGSCFSESGPVCHTPWTLTPQDCGDTRRTVLPTPPERASERVFLFVQEPLPLLSTLFIQKEAAGWISTPVYVDKSTLY
jgi:hypothetical protein